MAGKSVPCVVFANPTTYVGSPMQFFTDPVPVSAYSSVTLSLWVGQFLGSAPPPITVRFGFQESNDGVNFVDCDGIAPFAIPSNSQIDFSRNLTKAWFRATVSLMGIGVGVTCRCSGSFELRER